MRWVFIRDAAQGDFGLAHLSQHDVGEFRKRADHGQRRGFGLNVDQIDTEHDAEMRRICFSKTHIGPGRGNYFRAQF